MFAAAAAWLPGLRRLSLVGLNTQDARGAWPQSLVTYSDLGGLTQLRHLEVVDCHLPFLELGVQVRALCTLCVLVPPPPPGAACTAAEKPSCVSRTGAPGC